MTKIDEKQIVEEQNEVELELEENLYQMIVEHLGTDDQQTIEKWIEQALQDYIKENDTV